MTFVTNSRLQYNNQSGLLGADPGAYGTTITFAVAPNFATLTSASNYSQYIPLILDPGTSRFEIVWLTAYTAGSTTGTILRSAEDPAHWPSVAHPNGTWVCAPSQNDFNTMSAQAYPSTSQVIGAGATTQILLDTAKWDTYSNFNLTTGNFIAPVTGIYQCSAAITFAISANPHVAWTEIFARASPWVVNINTYRGYTNGDLVTLPISAMVPCLAGDSIGLWYFNNSSASTTISGANSGTRTFLSIYKVDI